MISYAIVIIFGHFHYDTKQWKYSVYAITAAPVGNGCSSAEGEGSVNIQYGTAGIGVEGNMRHFAELCDNLPKYEGHHTKPHFCSHGMLSYVRNICFTTQKDFSGDFNK